MIALPVHCVNVLALVRATLAPYIAVRMRVRPANRPLAPAATLAHADPDSNQLAQPLSAAKRIVPHRSAWVRRYTPPPRFTSHGSRRPSSQRSRPGDPPRHARHRRCRAVVRQPGGRADVQGRRRTHGEHAPVPGRRGPARARRARAAVEFRRRWRQEGNFDADTRWAFAWFEQYGSGERESGQADVLTRAKNTRVHGMI